AARTRPSRGWRAPPPPCPRRAARERPPDRVTPMGEAQHPSRGRRRRRGEGFGRAAGLALPLALLLGTAQAGRGQAPAGGAPRPVRLTDLGQVNCLAVSPGGKVLASGGSSVVSFWDLAAQGSAALALPCGWR